jgi:hypothetical protein
MAVSASSTSSKCPPGTSEARPCACLQRSTSSTVPMALSLRSAFNPPPLIGDAEIERVFRCSVAKEPIVLRPGATLAMIALICPERYRLAGERYGGLRIIWRWSRISICGS